MKKVIAVQAACHKALEQELAELNKMAGAYQRAANQVFMMHAGAASEGGRQAERTSKLLGRQVSSAVDLAEVAKAQKAFNELKEMMEALEKMDRLVKA